MRIIDVSPMISEAIAVFPGDQRFQRSVALSFKKGDHLDLSSMQSTLHLGAHADSTSHYHAQGDGVEQRNLQCYFGEAQVIEVQLPRNARIQPKDLLGTAIQASRVLFKTKSFPDPNCWNADFNSLSPKLIEYLHAMKVILVGIDTPSVDPAEDKVLSSHQALYKTGMAVLEGLFLKDVPPGKYFLSALPLKIQDADAAPVRAILIENFP